MSEIEHGEATVHSRRPFVASSAFVLLLLALAFGCGDAGSAPPPGGNGGSGGSGGSSGAGGTAGTGGMPGSGGTGGTSGTGGVAGSGGMSGTGGTSGTGGVAGSGGMSGTGGTDGTGGSAAACVTDALCHTCPDRFPCDTEGDCFSGYVCIASGCKTFGGAPIKQCQPSRGGSCLDVSDCPNATDYDCIPVGAGPKACVRVTAGCDPVTEAYDCAPGFSCENGSCVDRRVPCDSYLDCPKSHVCTTTLTASFCVRVYRTCHQDEDCAGFGSRCADVDGDSVKECVGELGSSGNACVNSDCGGSTPVCEMGAVPTAAMCGDYGLCRSDNDCDVGNGFVCVGLGQDGRMECVKSGGSCSNVTQCPLRQVCAAPRNGGSPSCQAGKEAI